MDPPSEPEATLWKCVQSDNEEAADKTIQTLNTVLQELEWPLESTEHGKAFVATFKKDGFSWFKKLCDRICGEETGTSTSVWKDFDHTGSWLTLASDATMGPAVVRELTHLLHPQGRFMHFLHTSSDAKKINEHWTQLRAGRNPDLSSANYVGYPFNTLPSATQRDWAKHWRAAVSGKGVHLHPSSSRQTTQTPIFCLPIWCPASAEAPFHTEAVGKVITNVMIAPFPYFMLRFAAHLSKAAEDVAEQSLAPSKDIVDFAVVQGKRVVNGVRKAVEFVNSLKGVASEADNAQAKWTKQFRLEGAVERLPGFCVIFDMFLGSYAPSPGQPYLHGFLPAKFQDNFLEGVVTEQRTEISQTCMTSFVACVAEVWMKGVIDLHSLMESSKTGRGLINDLAALSKDKTLEGVPMNVTVYEERAAEDIRRRCNMMVQLLSPFMRAVQFHDFLLNATPYLVNHGASGRVAALQRVCVSAHACRDARAYATQIIHLMLSMANGAAGEHCTYLEMEYTPTLEIFTLWSVLISPPRFSSARLPEAAFSVHPAQTTVLTPLLTANGVNSSSSHFSDLITGGHEGGLPVNTELTAHRVFFEVFIAIVNAVLPRVNVSSAFVELMQGVEKNVQTRSQSTTRGLTELEQLGWVRGHRADLDNIVQMVESDSALQREVDAVFFETAARIGDAGRRTQTAQGSLPRDSTLPSVQGAGLAFLIESQAVLLGGPFLSDWELSLLSAYGRKPRFLTRVMRKIPAQVAPVTHYCRTLLSYAKSLRHHREAAVEGEFYGTVLCRESKEILRTAVQAANGSAAVLTTSPGKFTPAPSSAQKDLTPYYWSYVKDNHELYTTLLLDFLELCQSDMVRDASVLTEEMLAAMHKVLCCVCGNLALYVCKGLGGSGSTTQQHASFSPPREHMGSKMEDVAVSVSYCLPSETWAASTAGFRGSEQLIAKVCMDLLWRRKQHQGVREDLVVLIDDVVAKLQELNPNVAGRVQQCEEEANSASEWRAQADDTPAGSTVQPRLTADDYDNYTLNEAGRQKVLGRGAPFEFRDIKRRGGKEVELAGPDSAWCHMEHKLPTHLRARFFPYRRPPGPSELRQILKLTRFLDSVVCILALCLYFFTPQLRCDI